METLDEIRKEIRERLGKLRCAMGTEHYDFHGELCDEAAKDILSIKVIEGGICPECKGAKIIVTEHRLLNYTEEVTCPNCNGTGTFTKTLGDIIEKELG